MTYTSITVRSKLNLFNNVYNSFATSKRMQELHQEHNDPWYRRIDQIYYHEAQATLDKYMLNLRLVHEFGMLLPDDGKTPLETALITVNASAEAWDKALKVYGSEDEVDRLWKQFLGFIAELERAIVNIVGESLDKK